jgi:hypothetical protein
MNKFVQRCRVGIFRKERIWSTPLDSKLLFWAISVRFITTQTSAEKLAKVALLMLKIKQ